MTFRGNECKMFYSGQRKKERGNIFRGKHLNESVESSMMIVWLKERTDLVLIQICIPLM